MTGITEEKADLWVGVGLLALCAFVAWRTLYIKAGMSSSVAGPSFLPWLMIGAIALLSLALMARALRRRAARLRDAQGAAPREIAMPDRSTLVKMGLFTLLLVAYAVAFMSVGYIPSTLVAFVAGLWLLGERRWAVLIVFPAAMTMVVWFGFTQLLSVWLP